MDNALSHVRIAVLIDADNTSPKYAEDLLDEIAKYGNPTIKRAYGDWSSPRLGGWAKELNARAIRGMHQNAFTTGKNSTDSALIIDAMDLLYADNVEGFALVTSDSDFTSLALRLRESGKTVYGLGRKRTPASLQNACDKFIQLEVLGEPDHDDDGKDDDKGEHDLEDDAAGPAPKMNLQSALTKAVNATADEDGWSSLDAIGSHLSRTHASFDPRTFGHAKLSSLVRAQAYLEVEGGSGRTRVRIKGRPSARPPAAKTATKTAAKTAPKAAAKSPAKSAAKKDSAAKTAAKTPAKAPAKKDPGAPSTADAEPDTQPDAASDPDSGAGSGAAATPRVTRVTRTTRSSRTAKKAAEKD